MNNLTLVEPHAKRLEDAADRMDKDGIGGHASRGHAAVLRDMASCMRADAARGKMPDVYNGGGALFGAAATDNAPKGRPLLTPLQASQAKQENAPLVQQIMATAARMNIDIDPTKVIDVSALNRSLAGRSVDERLAIKSMLARLHLIP
jgi:hypothetical protein